MTSTPIIEMENITAKYGDTTVFRNVTLTVYDRDFLGIIGPNGGGKTTLIRIMLGLMKPSEGCVRYLHNGKPVKEITIGYLPQYNKIDKEYPISVSEIVLSGLSHSKPLIHPFTKDQRLQVDEALNRLGIGELRKRHIGSLSGGQMQRVMLARAIVSRPEVVVLDEPNTYIDPNFQQQLYKELISINNNCAVVLVSHDVGSVMQNVRNIACVDHSLHYHSVEEVSEKDLERYVGCPIELLGHGDLPHRILRSHD